MSDQQYQAVSLPDWMPIIGVVIASVVQISVTDGPFTLWNFMVGILLMLVLWFFQPNRKLTFKEIMMLSGTWGFTLTLTTGVFSQGAFRCAHSLRPLLPPFTPREWEAPGWYFLIIWLLLSLGAVAYFYLRYGMKKSNG